MYEYKYGFDSKAAITGTLRSIQYRYRGEAVMLKSFYIFFFIFLLHFLFSGCYFFILS